MYIIFATIMRESSLMFWEYAKIVCSFNMLMDKGIVDKALLSRGFTKEQIEAMYKNNKGSVQSLNLILKPGFEDLEYPYFDFYYGLFLSYEKGTMPFKGPIVDQPAKIFEIFSTIRALNNEYEKEEREKQKRDAKRKR